MAWEQNENDLGVTYNGADLNTINPLSSITDSDLCNTPEAKGLKFRLYFRIVAILLALICICVFVIVLMTAERKILYVGMPCFATGFVMFITFFVISFTNRGYFKNKVVKTALSKHLDISYFRLYSQYFNNGLGDLLNMLIGAPGQKKYTKSDIMEAPCDKDLIGYLDIYVQGWNKGVFNDEICGTYNGKKFRFLDIVLYHEYRTGNNHYEREKLYGGQAYMFKMSEPIPIGVVYEVIPGEDYSKPELFSKAFKARPALIDGDMTPEVFAEVRKIIETPQMVETMMRFAEIWRGAVWTLSVTDDIMVFKLNREYLDMFEIKENNFAFTMTQLKADLDEFVEVVQKASSIDSLP